ncbi:hypothetical protein NA57DRAFT_80328 [Rhizodiscina lignyota]|uniref:Uncharacterized protein n=1 Tax=Rhizodiscina lignyota TaxID=1504668 RepID=A0A9P4M1E5_9PEZI|nr:hypothetical protein NA57DRAFT_80328 [Rhizodiscina lignyota]
MWPNFEALLLHEQLFMTDLERGCRGLRSSRRDSDASARAPRNWVVDDVNALNGWEASFSKLVSASVAIAWAVPPSLAQNLTSAGCVAPSDFQSCYDNASLGGEKCIRACGTDRDCIIVCGCYMYEVQIGCFVASCWNRAYTCDYQKFVIAVADQCAVSKTNKIPFWPAPADAPNSCSCNLENVYDTVVNSLSVSGTCSKKAGSSISDPSQAENNITGCACCAASGAISTVYDICPDTDPSLLDLSKIESGAQLALGGEGFSTCDSTLDSFNCVQDLGFPKLPGKGEYYAASNLPSSGTKTLYDTPGIVTSPPSGSVYTFAASSTTYLVTASPYKSENAAATGSESGNAAASDPASASGSAASTSSPSAAAPTSNCPVIISYWAGVLVIGEALWAFV